jgi:hypothetical protein
LNTAISKDSPPANIFQKAYLVATLIKPNKECLLSVFFTSFIFILAAYLVKNTNLNKTLLFIVISIKIENINARVHKGWLFVTGYSSIRGDKLTKSLSGKGFN